MLENYWNELYQIKSSPAFLESTGPKRSAIIQLFNEKSLYGTLPVSNETGCLNKIRVKTDSNNNILDDHAYASMVVDFVLNTDICERLNCSFSELFTMDFWFFEFIKDRMKKNPKRETEVVKSMLKDMEK